MHRYFPANELSPIIVNNPHSGLHVPEDIFLGIDEELLLQGLPDLYIDQLVKNLPLMGIPVFQFNLHRLVVDANKRLDEVSPNQLADKESWPTCDSAHVRLGRGLIPPFLRLDDNSEVPIPANNHLHPDDIRHRITQYYTPYRKALSDTFDAIKEHYGHALLIDMHSTYRLPRTNDMKDVVIGTDNWRTCNEDLIIAATEYFEGTGLSVVNEKFLQGGDIVKSIDRNSMQIEYSRDLLTDDAAFTVANPEKIQRMQHITEGFVNHMNTLMHELVKTPAPRHAEEFDQPPSSTQVFPAPGE